MVGQGAVRTAYGSGKYAAFHLLFCRWLRLYATPGEHCYVTLGGTELKDLESLSFVDRRLLQPCISYENRRDRVGYAEDSCRSLLEKGISARIERGDIFSYARQEAKPRIYFFDIEGICAWADYAEKFGEMFRKEYIREGDLIVLTSHLGHNPGWDRVFSTFSPEFRALKATGDQERRQWYRRAHPSFTLFRALHSVGLSDQLAIKCFACVEYRDKSPMAVYGYTINTGQTVFAPFVKDAGTAYFHLNRGLVLYAQE